MILNLGCGPTPHDGAINLDRAELPGVDIIFDLETCTAGERLPFPDNHFDEVYGSHILEHITGLLPVMEELWRVTRPGGRATFHVPYGGSDEAWEDPTHVRAFTQGSWKYFAATTWWMADTGYRGDWDLEVVRLRIPVGRVAGLNDHQVYGRVLRERNIVVEMIAELVAVKPARKVDGQPTFRTNVVLDLVDGEPNQFEG